MDGDDVDSGARRSSPGTSTRSAVSYSWYGRVAASPEVAALLASGVRKVVLRTPFASVETALSDVDPWGRPRVEGFGATPFEVLDQLPEQAQYARHAG